VAYRVLSRLLVANLYKADLSFLFIKNLGSQDCLLGGVNLLPVLMTLINILTVMLMTPTQKERRKSYVIAVFFLIFLYTSPAGLVLYWTSNNFINLLRYLFIYLKDNKFSAIKHTITSCFLRILKSGVVRVFLFLVSLYFVINKRISFFVVEDFNIFLTLPFYLLALLRIYDFVKESKINGCMVTGKRFFLTKVLLVNLCFICSVFVKTWSKIDCLCAALILLSIYNYRAIRFDEIKKLFKNLTLPIAAMLFPAVLYKASNGLYFQNHFEVTTYFVVLMAIACLLPLFIYVFNNRLSVDRVIKFSVAFILSGMFLPIIRDVVKYVGTTPIDFVLLLWMGLFIVGFLKKQKKVLMLFLLCTSFVILLVSVTKHISVRLKFESVDKSKKDLYGMKMKDTPAIYLFMQDAFPHRDLIKKLRLDSGGLDILLKKYNFTEYNVYSIFTYTVPAMASVFNIEEGQERIPRGYWPTDSEWKYLRSTLGGINVVNMTLLDNGYKTYLVKARGDKYTSTEEAVEIIGAAQYDNIILYALKRGIMNSMLLDMDHPCVEDLAVWASHKNNNDKIFAWACGYPGHATESGKEDYEIAKFKPKYYSAIEQIKRSLELTITNNPDAIIILMSDHGPWVLDDTERFHCEMDSDKVRPIHFRDSYGAFMAVRWPDKERAAKYDKEFNITQDLFPIVFAYLYDSPIPLKYKIKDTAVRIKEHKFDKGVFYPYFYKEEK
jgi:hypothetical protein